jgi:hypothetical protein
MNEADARLQTEARNDTLSKLAKSRAEIRQVLDPPRPTPESEPGIAEVGPAAAGGFPRSRTMKMLMSGRGVGTVGAVVGGLLMARPSLALRLLRMLPARAITRILVVRAISALRSRRY